MKPQEGIGCPSAPLRRGPDGLEFWLQGTMLKVAPVSTKYLSMVSLSVRKISPALVCIGIVPHHDKFVSLFFLMGIIPHHDICSYKHIINLWLLKIQYMFIQYMSHIQYVFCGLIRVQI
jgi:hypothetical protein